MPLYGPKLSKIMDELWVRKSRLRCDVSILQLQIENCESDKQIDDISPLIAAAEEEIKAIDTEYYGHIDNVISGEMSWDLM